ncbi:MAG: prolipoprotein diacylglyceryl transferase [Pseudomonadota bacterium]
METSGHLPFPDISPILLDLGILQIRWYSVMYLIGFAAAYLLAKHRLQRVKWTNDQLSDLLFWCFIGVIAGGRVGYVFFYSFSRFLDNPLYLFKLWEGGMSFHGGCIGVILAAYLFARKQKWEFLRVGDFITPLVPIGLGAGRIGNFINGELWGRVTDVPWAFVFPTGGPLPRHPSQLYQFFFEGLVLFLVLWIYSKKPRPVGSVGGLFLLGYGSSRFFVEFFREPDKGIGLNSLGLSQGQMLCIPMIIAGVILLYIAFTKHKKNLL